MVEVKRFFFSFKKINFFDQCEAIKSSENIHSNNWPRWIDPLVKLAKREKEIAY